MVLLPSLILWEIGNLWCGYNLKPRYEVLITHVCIEKAFETLKRKKIKYIKKEVLPSYMVCGVNVSYGDVMLITQMEHNS